MSIAGMGIPPPPPAPQEIDPFETVFDRPLTADELGALKRVERSPAIGATRVMATLFGIAPLFLMFMAFMGTPFDPDAFPMVLIGSAVIAIAMGAVSRAKRYPVGLAITKGSLREARGVPRRTTGPAGKSSVRLGDVEFTSTAAVMQNLQDGRMNSIVFVPPNEYAPNAAAKKRGWILGANGIIFKLPVSSSIIPATGDRGPPPPPPPMQSIWGGK